MKRQTPVVRFARVKVHGSHSGASHARSSFLLLLLADGRVVSSPSSLPSHVGGSFQPFCPGF